MSRALRTAATGMYAQQLHVDIIANNLANVNTTGFKKSRVEFQDLMYQTLKTTGTSEVQGVETPVEIQVGNGTQLVGTLKSFSQGDVQPTSNPLDIAIQGEGFLKVRRPDNTLAYTRDGSLKLSREGRLVTSEGYVLDPEITIPADAVSVNISRDGLVEVMMPGDTEVEEVGKIEFAKFVNPAGLKNIGNNLYVETAASGQAIVGEPGSQGFGEIVHGALEASNVDVVEEMVSMIVAQRAYEINSKTIKTAEEMMNMANNLKR